MQGCLVYAAELDSLLGRWTSGSIPGKEGYYFSSSEKKEAAAMNIVDFVVDQLECMPGNIHCP